MGVLSAAVARLLLVTLQMIISAIPSIIIVRRLTIIEYSVYSYSSKRVTLVVRHLYNIISYWFRRYSRKEDVAEYISLSLAFLPVTFLVSLFMLSLIGASPILAIVYSLYVTIASYTISLLSVYLAYRYVKSEFLKLIYRITYAIAIIFLVYYARLASLGVLLAQILASLIIVSLIVREVGVRATSVYTIKYKGLTIPLLDALIGILGSIDYLLLVYYGDLSFIAIYSVATLPSMILVELALQSMLHTLPFVVSTGDISSVLRGYKASLLLIAPLVGYIAARPMLTLSILNPKYVQNAYYYVIWASVLLANLSLTSRLSDIYTLSVGRELKTSVRLLQFYKLKLLVQFSKLMLLLLLLRVSSDKVLSFMIIIAVSYAISIIACSLIEKTVVHLSKYMLLAEIVTIAALFATRMLCKDEIHRNFMNAFLAWVYGLAAILPIYSIIFITDYDVRLLTLKMLKRICKKLRSR